MENQELDVIFAYYNTSKASLLWYRDGILNGRLVNPDYVGYTKKELENAFLNHIDELEKGTIFNIFSSLEARFQIDYRVRVQKRLKDSLSRKFRDLYKKKSTKVSLEHDILSLWKEEFPYCKTIVSNYIGALNYRHWLAHGRYWKPKLGKKYDLLAVSTIANQIYANLPFHEG